MSFHVICLSRTLAAGAEVVGHAVSQRLEFRYVDEEIVSRAAEKAKIDAAVVAAAEHKQPFLRRLIDALAAPSIADDPSGLVIGLPADAYLLPMIMPLSILPEAHRALIRDAIHEIAAEGRCVIVAHAASMALAGAKEVLRVLMTASPEVRAQRLLSAGQARDARAASAAVAASDRERRDYFKTFYHIKEERPTHYDLVINTDALSPEQAVGVILSVAKG